MSQWNQGQPGFQYPMQTGFPPGNPQFQQNPQFQPQNASFQQPGQLLQPQGGFGIPGGGGMVPQPTGFPVQRPHGMMQAQPTGFPGAPSLLQQQPTGFPGSSFQQGRPPPPPVPPMPPVPPIPPQFQGGQPSFLNAPPPPSNRLMTASPGFGVGLVPQQTGFPASGGMLVPQMTGFVDPRLQMMSQTFMPMNATTPSAIPQLQPQSLNLMQSIQQHNQAERGAATQHMSWAPTKAEKKNYDNIFRQWVKGAAFMSGATALEVFGASGLSKDDLARIWTLADVEDRGKLNLAEFHVAMALIYRRLNGMELPEQLPPELIPPSRRDLDDSVDRVKDLLEKESRNHSPASVDNPVSYLKNRTFNGSTPSFDANRDATIYKHSDLDQGNIYKPRSRHVDRDAIRSRDQEDDPSADLQDMKRTLGNTARMLDRAAEAEAQRTKEDEELAQEMSDLKYRVKRVQEDLDYNSRGPKSTSKENERRRLERELLSLLHERIPEVERKIKDREERKERERRQWVRERDRANERFGRYDSRDDYTRREDREDRNRPYSRGEDRDRSYSDRDRPYSRGEDRPRSRGTFDRDYDDRERKERHYERPYSPKSPPPPPAPPAPPAPTPPKSVPSPSPSPHVPPLARMTPEQRKAYLSEQAKLRVQARMAALGVTTPSSTSPSIDTSVEERLQQDKKEAEEKAKAAEKQAEERERVRRERLENEKALKEGRITPGPPTPAPATPTPTSTAPPPAPTPKARTPMAPPAPKAKVPPAPPKPRARPTAPPPPKAAAPPPVAVRSVAVRSVAPSPPKPPPEPEVDSEEEEMRAREEALLKARQEREKARLERQRKLKELEEEEAAAARREEEQYQKRMEALKAKAAKPATPPVSPPVASVPTVQPTAPAPSPPPIIKVPVPPPQPPAPANASVVSPAEKSTNPFSRLIKEGSSSTTPTGTNGAVNPWAKPQTALPVPSPSRSPAPSSSITSYQTAPSSAIDEDWGDVQENDDDDDSSDDDMSRSRTARANIAQKLFGGMVPRPSSTPPSAPAESSPAPASSGGPTSAPPAPAPPIPPPAPPVAPPAPPVAPSAAPSAPGDRGALFAAIQGGKALRPTKTVDKSGPPLSGKVLGDTAPPSHIHTTSQSPSPPPIPTFHVSVPEPPTISTDSPSKSNNRQSVGWVALRAADTGGSPVTVEKLPSTLEVEEEEPIPEVLDEQPTSDLMADVDSSIEHRVRSLYAFEGEGQEDLSFAENQIIIANPSKSGGDWWFGKLVASGKSGSFPKTYVEIVEPRKAKAIYSYEGGNPDELTFDEGETLDIIDTSEEEWWKAEQRGMVLAVPAAYLELVEVNSTTTIKVTLASEDQSDNESIAGASDSSSEYLSFDETDENEASSRMARERERQLVLEAAGFIVQKDVSPRVRVPPKGILKRRIAPAAPDAKQMDKEKPEKDLPPVPSKTEPDEELEGVLSAEPELSHEARLDDAYARYEAFKNMQATSSSNRLSVVSTESSLGASSPTASIGSGSLAGTRSESEGGRYPNLLHFLSRSKTPDIESKERRKSGTTLTISGPILRPVPSSVALSTGAQDGTPGSENPSFGLSWASLVDKTALDGIPPGERKRQEAIFELINTEVAYVRDLQLIVEVFFSSMLPLLSTKEITVVFANVEDILLTNTGFVSSLEQHQKDCRLYVDKIGDILLSHIPNMGVYMEYCVNQPTAIKMLQSLRDSKPDLATHLQRLRDENPAVRNLDLSSYLLVPMQRITRYPLLIKQILQYTEAGAEHDTVAKARDLSEKLLDNINETIREQENHETLRKISENLWIGQGRLDLTAPTRNMGPRRLLKQGSLTKARSGRKLQAFLCSDVLVLTDEAVKNLYRMPIPLAHAQVKESKIRDGTGFEILQDDFRRTETVFLRATSSRECQQWVQEVHQASKKARHAEERAARKLGVR